MSEVSGTYECWADTGERAQHVVLVRDGESHRAYVEGVRVDDSHPVVKAIREYPALPAMYRVSYPLGDGAPLPDVRQPYDFGSQPLGPVAQYDYALSAWQVKAHCTASRQTPSS